MADRLDALPPDEFMRWANGLPHYSQLADDWTSALKSLGALRGSKVYDDILQGKHPQPTVSAIEAADRASLVGYATYLWRGEKFSYGFLGGRHADGSLSAVLRRFAELEKRRWFF
ncbi:MAG: DUF6508 domain-containing protein [Brevundimonas sp.]|nr:DUF6508 domain-containing protein [Brevundimonas sp.]